MKSHLVLRKLVIAPKHVSFYLVTWEVSVSRLLDLVKSLARLLGTDITRGNS